MLPDKVNQIQQFDIPNFTMLELNKAISKIRRELAPGPDDVFLKEIGPTALKELLYICNQSLRSAECPQGWGTLS